jgi:hypothetical protein
MYLLKELKARLIGGARKAKETLNYLLLLGRFHEFNYLPWTSVMF